jgi:signal transduction histidine kinase
MLHDFVAANRDAILGRTRPPGASRTSPSPSATELANGIPVFLHQLVDALRLARSSEVIDHEHLRESARRHSHDLLRRGLPIAQLVNDYGDVFQAITELAVEQAAPISEGELRTLHLCLDEAIAAAVTEYALQRERSLVDEGTERLGILAHALRNKVNAAMISFEDIQSGRVPAGGSAGLLHSRSLVRMCDLIDRALAPVRPDVEIDHCERISVAEIIEEVEIAASMRARARGLHLAVTSLDPAVTVEGDRQVLATTVSSLVQNALNFTRSQGKVSLSARATADRVLIEVADECGDLLGKGCVFTIDLPRKPTEGTGTTEARGG